MSYLKSHDYEDFAVDLKQALSAITSSNIQKGPKTYMLRSKSQK